MKCQFCGLLIANGEECRVILTSKQRIPSGVICYYCNTCFDELIPAFKKWKIKDMERVCVQFYRDWS